MNDPDWQTVMNYAGHKRFDTANPTNVTKCTRSDGTVYYVAALPSTISGRDPAGVVYDTAQAQYRTTLTIQKNAHTLLSVTQVVTHRISTRTDGTVKRMQLLDLSGHRIRPSPSPAATWRAL